MQDRVIIERIASRYPSRWTRGYVHGKMRMDPAYRITLDALREFDLPILDIGCGLGFLAFYLREHGLTAPILGIDNDADKIERANCISKLHYPGLNFRVADASTFRDFYGNVVMLDVLQYFDYDRQLRFLEALPAMVNPAGQCLIRATPRDSSWRFKLTEWDDRAMNTIRWISSPVVHYLSADEITLPFIRAGFEVEIRPLWGCTPFNSHLFLFRKKTRPSPAGIHHIESPPSTVST